jgi:hypothetical protein
MPLRKLDKVERAERIVVPRLKKAGHGGLIEKTYFHFEWYLVETDREN